MGNVSFDGFTRRASLVSLGAAGMAVLASPVTAAAKNKKKKKGDVNKRRKQQAADWLALIQAECPDPACLIAFGACAEPLKSCNFSGFITCFSGAV